MKSLRNTVLAFLAVAAISSAAVDPALLNMVPPDAKIISGIQVDQSKASKFGQYVLGQMTSDNAGMKQFIADTGFDPRRDLNEIVVATTGTTEAPQFVVVGRGVFNPSRILTAAQANGAEVTSYNGIQLLSHADAKSDNAIGFIDAGTAVMGTTAAVKAAIDRRGSATKLDAATLNKVRDLSNANDAWFLSTVPVTDFLAGKMGGTDMGQAMGGNLFQSIKAASGGVKFTTNAITISGEAVTRSDQDATALADVIRFVAGLVQQSKDNSEQAKQAASLLSTLQLSTQSSTLKLSLSIPEDVAEKLFMPSQNKARAHRKTVAQVR